MDQEKLAFHIKELLDSNDDLTQAGLARYCAVSGATVNKWVNGKLKISDKYIPKIESYLNAGNLKVIITQNQAALEKEKKYELIHEDLTRELEMDGKFGSMYEFLVDHAVSLFKLTDELQDDITINGLRVTMNSGNGHLRQVDNPSIKNLSSASSQLMKVLKELGINKTESYVEEMTDLNAL